MYTHGQLDGIWADNILVVNACLRLAGLVGFSMLFVQLVIGANMNTFTQLIGAKAYRFHIVQGLVFLGLIFAHPLFYSIENTMLLGRLVPFLIPLDFSQRELFIGLGRIGFYLFLVTILSAYFRTKPFFRKKWELLHQINYFLFYFIAAHAFLVGTDTIFNPFKTYFWIALAIVIYFHARNSYPKLKKHFQNVVPQD